MLHSFEETSANLIPLLKLLATDGEWVVRQHLGEQLGGISEVSCLLVYRICIAFDTKVTLSFTRHIE